VRVKVCGENSREKKKVLSNTSQTGGPKKVRKKEPARRTWAGFEREEGVGGKKVWDQKRAPQKGCTLISRGPETAVAGTPSKRTEGGTAPACPRKGQGGKKGRKDCPFCANSLRGSHLPTSLPAEGQQLVFKTDARKECDQGVVNSLGVEERGRIKSGRRGKCKGGCQQTTTNQGLIRAGRGENPYGAAS